jgi:KaiC/GvpD/RAD55 family RecA-like ATPase
MEFLTLAELSARPVPAWRVTEVIPERGLVVVYGASGSGKTFAVLDMAFEIPRGLPWAGRQTFPATVAYVAAEGQLWPRAEAYLKHHGLGVADVPGLRVLQHPINLLRDDDETSLIASLNRVSRQTGGVKVVIIDTLSRSMPGGNENAPEDMGRVIAVARRIEEALGCVVIFIHHSGKDEAKGSRGHSSLKAATDAELSVQRDKNDTDLRTVTIEKLRDGADGETLLQFRLKSVDLGPLTAIQPTADPSLRRTSCVVQPEDQSLAPVKAKNKPTRKPTGGNQQIVFRILSALISEVSAVLPETSTIPAGVGGVRYEDLLARAADKMPGDQPWRRRDRAQQALAGLIGGGFADRQGDWVWML